MYGNSKTCDLKQARYLIRGLKTDLRNNHSFQTTTEHRVVAKQLPPETALDEQEDQSDMVADISTSTEAPSLLIVAHLRLLLVSSRPAFCSKYRLLLFLDESATRAAPGSETVRESISLDSQLLPHVSTIDGLEDTMKATAIGKS
jgi:hypothetical protein